jgi:CheY-like chemotaxis protein
MNPPQHRVLLVEPSLPYRRVLTEAITSFFDCEVDDALNGESGFDLALKRNYTLYMLAYQLPDMTGELLDRLLAKAVPLAQPEVHSTPPIVYLLHPEDVQQWQHLQRAARSKGHLLLPPKLDKLISVVGQILPRRANLALPV